VALCSEAIATSLPDPVLHRRRSVRIGIRIWHSAPRSHECGRPKAVPTRCSLGDDPRKRHLAGRIASRASTSASSPPCAETWYLADDCFRPSPGGQRVTASATSHSSGRGPPRAASRYCFRVKAQPRPRARSGQDAPTSPTRSWGAGRRDGKAIVRTTAGESSRAGEASTAHLRRSRAGRPSIRSGEGDGLRPPRRISTMTEERVDRAVIELAGCT
jgi:hypothetical protein